jgi:hypothetical protein
VDPFFRLRMEIESAGRFERFGGGTTVCVHG